jgi:hypothetical protein
LLLLLILLLLVLLLLCVLVLLHHSAAKDSSRRLTGQDMVRAGLPSAPEPCAHTVCDSLVAELTLTLTNQTVTAVAASVELRWGVVQQVLRTTHNTWTVAKLSGRHVGLGGDSMPQTAPAIGTTCSEQQSGTHVAWWGTHDQPLDAAVFQPQPDSWLRSCPHLRELLQEGAVSRDVRRSIALEERGVHVACCLAVHPFLPPPPILRLALWTGR